MIEVSNNDWYHISNIHEIDSPALVLYKSRIIQNIAVLKEMVHNDVNRLRPHVKTNKIAEVCKLMLDAGITKFKCATIAEAEMLAMINAPDILLAYQPVGPKALRLAALQQKYPTTKFSCLIDNINTAAELTDILLQHNTAIDVYIDLNTGMNRSGIIPANALQLFEAAITLKGINIIGLHGYDGHIRATDVQDRKHIADEAFNNVIILAQAIEALANKPMKIVAGGSPTFPIHAKRSDVECSPGTFVFWDWGYATIVPDEPFIPAALVVTRIISIINEEKLCLDLGHKSVAAENPFPRVHFLNAPDATAVSQSEEHLVMKVDNTSLHHVGEVWYGVPYHICPTVALYERACIIEDGKAVATWDVVARDRKITV